MELEKRIFAASPENFNELALDLFRYQHQNNTLYRQYCDALKVEANKIRLVEKIPFLPISFFKSHAVKTTEFETDTIFESSGTTSNVSSKHYIKDISLYRESFMACFEKFYGLPKYKCILGLLPSYLERKNSSLVMMTEALIKESNNELSGFYLDDHEKLHRTIIHNELLKIPTMLIGVTYALLDFAEKYKMQLRHTIVMETGGMKGRRQELTRQEVHAQLQQHFGLKQIHSEYGMTELLSQAYSQGEGLFGTAPWMKVLLRAADDPFDIISSQAMPTKFATGAINIIDLANLYSCAFLATDDVGKLYNNGSFEVLGRLDNSDIRGCGLMIL